MAKRARGASGRPGQRRSTQRSGSRPQTRPATGAVASQPPSLEPVDQAYDDDASIAETGSVARPAPAARGRTRTSSAVFEELAAQEYAYVAADVRRIAIVGGGLFAILIALFLLIEVFGIIHI